MLHRQDNIVDLEDPLASCVAPQQKAVISQQLIGGSELCWYSLIGCCQCVWWLANEGEKLKLKVTVALPDFFFSRAKNKGSITELALDPSHALSCIKEAEFSRHDKTCLL